MPQGTRKAACKIDYDGGLKKNKPQRKEDGTANGKRRDSCETADRKK